MTCSACTSQYVASLTTGPASNQDCPFCKLVKRYLRDPRLQASFPLKAMPDVSAIEFGLSAFSKHVNV
jgi:hypothetical protein